MAMTEPLVQDHYTHGDLLSAILAQLETAGIDLAHLTVDDLAPVDHLHGRGREATDELVAALAPLETEHVLDIGSGLGGPARYLASRNGCRVTGVDLTAEFVEVANALSRMTGWAKKVTCQQGSALDLPFADGTFDKAYTHNVSMSIADKDRFFSEAYRVLKPGGRLLAIEVAKGPGGDVLFPVPWAMTPDISHLCSQSQTEEILQAAGFNILTSQDTTPAALAWQAENRKRVERDGMPVLSPMVVLRERAMERFRNASKNLAEDRVRSIEILSEKAKNPQDLLAMPS